MRTRETGNQVLLAAEAASSAGSSARLMGLLDPGETAVESGTSEGDAVSQEFSREELALREAEEPRRDERAVRIAHLETELARYRAIFDQAHDALAETSGRGVVLAANAQFGAMLGVAPAFLCGKPLLHFVGRADTQPFRAFVSAVEARAGSGVLIARLRPRHGGTLFVAEMRARVTRLGARRAVLWCVRPQASVHLTAAAGAPATDVDPR